MRFFVAAPDKRTAAMRARRAMRRKHRDAVVVRVDELRKRDRIVYGGVVTWEEWFEFQVQRTKRPKY